MPNWQGNVMQILVLILMVGVPAIGSVIKKIREQAEIKAARTRQRSMEMESLRSTHVVERTPPADERSEVIDRQRAMRDLAVQRQAQLQELRQRQLEAARQRQQAKQQDERQQDDRDSRRSLTGTPPVQVRQGQTGAPSARPQGVPGMPGVGSAPRPGVRVPQPVIAPTQRRREPRPTPKPPVTPVSRARQAPAQRQEPAPASTVPTTSKKLARPDRLGVRAMLFGTDGRPRSHTDIQRIFALNEVLSKPVSMRTDREIGNGL